MCQFISGLGLPNGDLITSMFTDSHEDMIEMHNLNDNHRGFQRLEYVPVKKNVFDGDYTLKTENYREDWATDELMGQWRRKFVTRLKKRIIKENTKLLIGGSFVLVGRINIESLGSCCKILDAGSAKIKYANSARIKNAGSAIIENAGLAIIEDANSSTIKNAGSAIIRNAGSARIKDADLSIIEDAGSAKIKYANLAIIGHANSSTIKYACSAIIENADSATIKYADFATIRNADSATIKNKQKAKISFKYGG